MFGFFDQNQNVTKARDQCPLHSLHPELPGISLTLNLIQ